MKILLYKGTSALSRAIRFVTRSPYSHAAFQFDEQTEKHPCLRYATMLAFKKAGAVVEAWSGGNRNVESASSQHTPGTDVDVFDFRRPLTVCEEGRLIIWLDRRIGWPYDYRDICAFITRRPGRPGCNDFCSMLVSQGCDYMPRPLFRSTEAWRVPPDWLARTRELEMTGSFITT